MRSLLCIFVIIFVLVSISASPVDVETSVDNGDPVDAQFSDGREYTLFDVEKVEQGHENAGSREARQIGFGYVGLGGHGGYGYRGGYGRRFERHDGYHGGHGGYRGGYGGYNGGYGGYRGGYGYY